MEENRKKTGGGIGKVLFFYWVVLVVWQNLGGVRLRGDADTLLKVGLLSLLVIYYMFHAKTLSGNIFIVLFFAICVIIALYTNGDSLSLSNLVAYVYPVLLALLVYVVGNDFQINKKELSFILHGVIIVATYAAMYSVLFLSEELSAALSMEQAYGNELSSFFISNHEYGMYLLFAIAACMIFLASDKGLKKWKNFIYLFLILFLGVNLVLTFSRTTLLALIVFIATFCFLDASGKLRKWLWLAVVGLLTFTITSSAMQKTIELLLFKGKEEGDLGSREILTRLAVDKFVSGTNVQKAFGWGYGIREYFEHYADHGSVHNAYLQVLLYFGIMGISFVAVVLLGRMKGNISIYSQSKFYSVTFLAILLAGASVMVTNTSIVFTSPIDSYFLTIMVIVIPKYVCNSIRSGTFDS